MPDERKLVTILFADVTGSTALADSMDPENVRALMSRYYEHAHRIITAYSGKLEKFIGDAVMAIFGFSQAHGDDAERALAAALALRDAIASDEILHPLFRLRIGVNTGEVVATSNPERLDFLVTGDAVNVSARLQQGAEPDEIIVSERTARAARKAFLFGEERMLQAKGKPLPLRVFPLTSRRPSRQVERPPFVGRLDDLLHLEILKLHVRNGQRSRLASLIAPAGTGKSRLLEEFVVRFKPSDKFQVAYARCLPYGQTLTYWPLRGMLTDLLGHEPDRGQIRSVFRQGGYSEENASRLTEHILTTLGMEEGKSAPSDADSGTSVPTSEELGKIDGWLKFVGLEREGTSDSGHTIWSDERTSMKRDAASDAPGTVNPPPQEPLSIPTPQVRSILTSSINELARRLTPGPDFNPLSGNIDEIDRQGNELGELIRANIYRSLKEIVPSRFYTPDRSSLFDAWSKLIEALTRQSPRILIFEDLHWASDALLELIEHLIHALKDVPVLFIATGRPELQDRSATWGGKVPGVTTMHLQPLGDAETLELLDRMPVTIPENVRQLVIERSGGNPFFALELMRGYVEHVQRGGATDIIALPDTVHAAVLARIDLLAPQERTLLQSASAANRSFSREWLASLLDESSEQDVDEALDDLLGRDMLVALESGRYAFRHALVRDVAYGTLSRAERVRLHSKSALWMEAAATDHLDEYIGLIAYHYREAIQCSRQSAVPIEMPFQAEQAARALERAGLLAGRTGSYEEARMYLQLAIDLAPESECVRLYEELAESTPHGEMACDTYQKALDCWRSTEERLPLIGARLLRKLLIAATRHSFLPRFTFEEVTAMREEALALVEQSGDEEERWRIRLIACFDLRYCDSEQHMSLAPLLAEQRVLAKEAAAYFEQHESWEALSEALDAYGALSMHVHDLPEALNAMQRRLTIPNLPAGEWADAVGSLADCHFLMGDYDACISDAWDAFKHLKPGQSVIGFQKVVGNAAFCAFNSGRWDELDRLRSKMDEIHALVQTDKSALVSLVRAYHSILLLAMAREDSTLIAEMAARVRRDGELLGPGFARYLDGLLEGDAQKIRVDYPRLAGHVLRLASLLILNERGVALSEEEISRVNEDGSGYRCWREIAQALTANDNDRLAQAIDEAEANGLAPHAARMRLVLAQRCGDLTHFERARPVLERLGDRQGLRRLQEISEGITTHRA
ncbi:adenylate/guanylate cyclase domain-containing protein [Ktedonospora formicarum]|uniref:Guanylate cyclase domain-containing protein n=1 Tax=Ktedonospora formicarum TaxID=2778364 RepID=A0A8J3I5J6_9CHLR|nr:adenylate/guanylate cyclase domain-containing protein [Ktedonospora formicarum]GHO46522.1 hypothetical protein KSX_46850 [Ktedonospora formicarum]